jgi:hypothetical protein
VADYPKHLGQWRVVIVEADGDLFQWHSVFSDKAGAFGSLEEANKEFPTEDGHSAARVQELMGAEDDETSTWVDVEE